MSRKICACTKGSSAGTATSGRITRDIGYGILLGVGGEALHRPLPRQIENDGGESFFHPVGCLRVMPDAINRRQYIAANEAIGDSFASYLRALER